MLIYKDILGMLKEKGYTTYKLGNENLLSHSTLQAIRENKNLNTKNIDKICTLLKCQPNDIMYWKEND